MRLKDFDQYDRSLLWIAVRDGHLYAQIMAGAKGLWVTAVSVEDPSALLVEGVTGKANARVVRLDQIEGLAGSAPQPAAEAGPWLRSIGLG